jgi:hypothetical protein
MFITVARNSEILHRKNNVSLPAPPPHKTKAQKKIKLGRHFENKSANTFIQIFSLIFLKICGLAAALQPLQTSCHLPCTLHDGITTADRMTISNEMERLCKQADMA